MRNTPFILAALGTLLLTGACRSGPTDLDDRLTDREARNLMPTFLAASWRSMEKHLANYAADANRPLESFTDVESCPEGGEIRLVGTVSQEVDQATGARSVRMEATKTPVNCTYSDEGRTFTLSGTLPLTVLGTGTIVDNQPGAAQVSEAGAFSWRIDDRNGTCSVDLAAAIDTRERNGLLTGIACRRTLNDSISWPAAVGD